MTEAMGLKLEYQAPVAAIVEPGTRYVVVIGYLDQTRVVITSSASEDAGALAGWSIGNSLRKKNGDVWRTLTPADAGRRVFPADKRPVLRTEVRGTSLNSSSIIVSLTKVGEGQLKATATASAPFDIVLPLTVNSGTGASSATIPANSTESEVLTVSRTPGTTLPVSVDIGDLPNVPSTHSEYALFKSPSRLSVQVIDGVPGGGVPVCDRTPEVRDSIVKAAPVGSCGEVTEAHLSGITALYLLNNQNIKALNAGDFSGMSSLTSLDLGYNNLTTLPDGIFDGLTSLGKLDFYAGNFTSVPDAVLGLTSLTSLNLGYNPLSSLPAGTFDRLTQLTRLDLSGDNLGALPVGIFDHLTELQRLNLEYAKITSLPDGVFDNLTSLSSLNLDGLRSASLPDGVFSWLASLKSLSLRDSSLGSLSKDAFFGLSGLASLNLYGNRLTNLPSGIFSGLSSLTSLNLSRSRLPPLLDPLSLTVSLEKVGEGQFKAVAPTGAPFEIVLPLSVANGSISGGAITITIPAGRVDSDTLTVARTPGTTFAVTVDIGTLPSLPTDVNQYGTRLHQGYTLVEDPALPLEVFPGQGIITPVCDRTTLVRAAIVRKAAVSSCSAVTEAHLAAITSLHLDRKSITSLKAGDFSGLSALTTLYLSSNQLTTLPEGVFSGLSALTRLSLERNQLTTLPEGVFSGLSALTSIYLHTNQLTTLPEGVFSGLSALTYLFLRSNQLTTLPEGVFSGLSVLRNLSLRSNQLTTLPEGVFSGLSVLRNLSLRSNQLTTLPAAGCRR